MHEVILYPLVKEWNIQNECKWQKTLWGMQEYSFRSSLIRISYVYGSLCIIWTPWCILIPYCSNFRIITALVLEFQLSFSWYLWTEMKLKRNLKTIWGRYAASSRRSVLLYGPRQANLLLIADASSEGSGEPAHPRSLARTFAARSYKQWVKRNLQTESQIPGPSEWLGMRSWNLSWRNARRHKFAWRGSYYNAAPKQGKCCSELAAVWTEAKLVLV